MWLGWLWLILLWKPDSWCGNLLNAITSRCIWSCVWTNIAVARYCFVINHVTLCLHLFRVHVDWWAWFRSVCHHQWKQSKVTASVQLIRVDTNLKNQMTRSIKRFLLAYHPCLVRFGVPSYWKLFGNHVNTCTFLQMFILFRYSLHTAHSIPPVLSSPCILDDSFLVTMECWAWVPIK